MSDAREALAQAPLDSWANALGDRAATEQRGLSALLEAGERILASSDEDRCPLCLVEQDRGALLERVAERAAQLATVNRKFHDAEQRMLEHEQAVQRLDRAIGAILTEEADSELDPTGELSQTRDDLRVYLGQLQNARRGQTSAPNYLPLPSKAALAHIQQAALAAPTQIGPAMLELSTLKGLRMKSWRNSAPMGPSPIVPVTFASTSRVSPGKTCSSYWKTSTLSIGYSAVASAIRRSGRSHTRAQADVSVNAAHSPVPNCPVD